MEVPPLIPLYRWAATLATPLIARRRIKALQTGGFDRDRGREVLGHATQPRNEGPLIWIHAVSVGEAKSALSLARALMEAHTGAHILMTTTTAGAALVLAPTANARFAHQFAPLDGCGPVRRFLAHWRPDLGLFVESEIWPNLIVEAARQGVALGLVNARLSARAVQRWHAWPRHARAVFRHFKFIHCQNKATEAALQGLGLVQAKAGFNLKAATPPPEPVPAQMHKLRAAFAPRPLWAAVSTHPGEDEIMLKAHAALRVTCPDAALILVPRHPERAGAIRVLAEKTLRSATEAIAQRSLNEIPGGHTALYLADTLGETDLWFALAPICCLCGSFFAQTGGHTPFEPVAAGAALLHGPHYANHREAYERLQSMGASIEVKTVDDLAQALCDLIRQPAQAAAQATAAQNAFRTDASKLTTALAQDCLALVPRLIQSDHDD